VKATYQLTDFVSACAMNDNSVQIRREAQKDAGEHFMLKTRSAVLGFIANGGLESAELIKTKKLEKNFHSTNTIMVDSYKFHSGSIEGYIAFYQPTSNAWIVKSLKKFDPPGAPKNQPFIGLGKLVKSLEHEGDDNEKE
jgi:hypothetical protein